MDYLDIVSAGDPCQVVREPGAVLFNVALHVNHRVSIFDSQPEDVQPHRRESNVRFTTVPNGESATSRMHSDGLVTAVRRWWAAVRRNDGGLVSLLTRDLPRRL